MEGSPDGGSTDPRAPRAIDAALAPGAVLGGRYRVRRRIGGGGGGSVWRVHDDRTGEDVALKVLPPRAGGDALARFRREVTLARRIAHPNVCRVFDLGDGDGLHVLTMELIEGDTLRARIGRGPVPWPDARRWIDDVLAGLAAVHAAGVVHRDVKPDNVLLAADGRAVIVDFGLAWAPAIEAVTAPEVGTPQYMAPEQLAGVAVDPRSDVFAAAVVIQEVLDGRPPFEGATPALVSSAILRDAPRPLDGAGVPEAVRPAIARLLARALARDREARFADAAELLQAWREAVTPVAPRRRGVLIAAAAAAVAAVAVVVVVLARRGGAPVPPARVPSAPIAGAIAKPAAFVIVPPWAPGAAHTVLQAYGTAQHRNTSSESHSNDYYALDLDLALDEPVHPVAPGTVIYAGPAAGGWAGYGTIVLVEHEVGGERYQSLYAHLSRSTVAAGAHVSPATELGRAGQTGAAQVELHLAIYRGATFVHADGATGPYGGVAVVPEPFASCARPDGGACAQLAAGDVLHRR